MIRADGFCASAAIVLAAVAGGPAVASTDAAGADAAQAPSEVQLEEVVVTAQKRPEKLQSVPIAISALSAESLESAHAQTTMDLQFDVPSLEYTMTDGFAQARMRGIGNSNNQVQVDPSVGTYVDGFYISGPQSGLTDLLGVERVEVLNGPQGTLYGRNSVGGAINIYTLTPTQEPDAMLALTGGNYGTAQVNGYVSGGLGDKLAVGIYFAGSRNDEWTDQIVIGPTSSKKLNQDVSGAVRIKAVYTPNDWLKVSASAEVSQSNSGDFAVFRADTANSSPLGWGFGATQISDNYTQITNQPDWYKQKASTYILRSDVDLDWARLVGISGYRQLVQNGETDADGTDANLFSFEDQNSIQMFSQELQLISPEASSVKWIAGLYYSNQQAGQNPFLLKSLPPISPFPAATAQRFDVLFNSYAAFAQATFPLTVVAQDLNLTLGGRYTVDDQHFTASQFSSLLDVATNNPASPIPGSQIEFPHLSKDWSAFTPKVTLDYKVLPRTMVYATWAKGYQEGIFNGASPASPGPVNPEKLTSYELGSKSTGWDNRAWLNLAAFHYDFKDLQVQATPNANTVVAIIENAARATYEGVEGSANVQLTGDLKLSGGVTYVDSYYNSFPNAAVLIPNGAPFPFGLQTVVMNVSGTRVEQSPRWVTTLSAGYNHKFDSGHYAHANIGWYRNSGFYWQAGELDHESAYNILNGSFGYTIGRWDTSFWITNALNTYYRTEDAATVFANLVENSPPRMFGVTFKWKLH